MSIFDQDSETGNTAEADARIAFEQGDKRLLALMTRGLSVPGVDSDLLESVKQRCGTRTIQSTDVIKSDEQFEAMKQQSQYMRDYNTEMLKLCQ